MVADRLKIVGIGSLIRIDSVENHLMRIALKKILDNYSFML